MARFDRPTMFNKDVASTGSAIGKEGPREDTSLEQAQRPSMNDRDRLPLGSMLSNRAGTSEDNTFGNKSGGRYWSETTDRRRNFGASSPAGKEVGEKLGVGVPGVTGDEIAKDFRIDAPV